jgi:hypothetical protein
MIIEMRNEDGELEVPCIAAFPDIQPADIMPDNFRVTEQNTIRISFDYPLTTPTVLEFHSPSGFDAHGFLGAVYEGYSKIYAAKEDPYGIWGHDVDELTLDDFSFDEATGIWTLGVGS